MPDKRKILIKLNPATLEKAVNHLNASPAFQIFDGEIVFSGSDGLGVSDCSIEWADGEIIRDAKAIEERIETLVKDYFEARETASEPSPPAARGDHRNNPTEAYSEPAASPASGREEDPDE